MPSCDYILILPLFSCHNHSTEFLSLMNLMSTTPQIVPERVFHIDIHSYMRPCTKCPPREGSQIDCFNAFWAGQDGPLGIRSVATSQYLSLFESQKNVVDCTVVQEWRYNIISSSKGNLCEHIKPEFSFEKFLLLNQNISMSLFKFTTCNQIPGRNR